MKNLLALLFACGIFMYGSAQTWQWAKQTSGGGGGEGYASVAIDASGNTYVVGRLIGSSSVTFGSITIACSPHDVVLVKYNSAGVVQWVRNTPVGNSDVYPSFGVAVDGSNNPVIIGNFNSASITFGSYTFTNVSGDQDMYVVKYDPSGNVTWAIHCQSNNLENDGSGFSIATDASSNIYITGATLGSTFTVGSTTISMPSGSNMITAKISPSGSTVWLTGDPNMNQNGGLGIAVDGSGNVYVSGSYIVGGAEYGILVKFNSSGAHQWTKIVAGNSRAYAVHTDGSGNVYIGGTMGGPNVIVDGSITLTNASPGTNDVYLAKFTAAGNVVWAQRFGGTNTDWVGVNLGIDNSGNVVLPFFSNSASFALGANTYTNTGSGTYDIYWVNVNSATGAVASSGHVGGTGNDFVNGMDIQGSDMILASSFSSSPLNFGSHSVSLTIGTDSYIAKFDFGCPSAGTACNDGNANTTGDIEDGNCNCAGISATVPTLGTWGLILLSLLTLTMVLAFMLYGQGAMAVAGTTAVLAPVAFVRNLPFDRALLAKVMMILLPVAMLGFVAVHYFIGTNGMLDFTGTMVSAVIVGYMVHLVMKKNP